MKLKYLLALILSGLCASLAAQIKIGDNPQNIDPASVLELESSSRVLVITRVSTAEMNAINPLPGGLIYNTDDQCMYYFNGAEWLNLCNLGLELTADAIVNAFPTIVLTENGNATNVEVGEIRGENIVDFSISAVDIQNNSITSDKLAPNSVGVEELQDNTVADAEIDYNQVTISDFINDVGYITSAQIISTAPGNDLIDNGGAFYDDAPLQNGIATNAAAIAADGDTDATNELQDLTISAFTLGITGGNTVDLGVFYQSAGDVQFNPYLTINSNNVQAAIQELKDEVDAVSGGGSDDQLLTLSGNTLSIEDGNSVDLSPFDDSGTDDQNLTLTGNEIFIEDGNSIDLTPILGGGGGIIVSTDANNDIVTGTDGGAFYDDPDNDPVNEIELPVGGNNGQVLATDGAGVYSWVDNAGGAIIISTDAGNDISAGTDGGAYYDDPDNDPVNEIELPVGGNNGQVLATDGAGVYSWVDNAGGGTIVSTDADNDLAAGTDGGAYYDDPDNDPVNEIELPVGGNNGQVLATDGAGVYSWVDNAGGGIIVSADADNDLAAGTDGGAYYDDPDNDPVNEIELPVGGNNGQVLSTDGAGIYSWVDNGGAHFGSQAGSLFFANDTDFAPTDFGNSLFWDVNARFMSGALYIGTDGGPVSDETKVHVMEGNGGGLIRYPIQIQNRPQNPNPVHDTNGSSVGLLFSVENVGAFGKGSLVFERKAPFGVGDFHFLIDTNADTTIPDLADAVLTITNTGSLGIGTTTPAEQLHVTGNFELEGDLIAQNGAGTLGQVLTTTAAGTEWAAPAGGLTGTPGSVFFADDPSGNPTENNSQLFWDNTALKLYVGNPVATAGDVKLNVDGTTRTQGIKNSDGTAGTPAYRFTNDISTGMYLPAIGEIGFSTNNTEAIRIDGAQNVGIGTATPNSTLVTNGSFATNIRNVPAGPVLGNDHTVIFNTSGAITLPIAGACTGRVYILKNTAAASTIDTYVDNTGASSTSFPTGTLWLQSDGTDWHQVN